MSEISASEWVSEISASEWVSEISASEWVSEISATYMLERWKKEASKVIQTTKQSNTAYKAVTFPTCTMYELPRVGLEPTPLYTLDRALYH